MFCKNCGNKADDDAKFCESCGKAMSSKNSSPPPPPEETNNENEESETEAPSQRVNNDLEKYNVAQVLVYDGWSKFHNNQHAIMFIENDQLYIQFNSGGATSIMFKDITDINVKKLSLLIPKQFGFEVKTRSGTMNFVSGGKGKYSRLWKWNANGWVNSIRSAMDNWKNKK